MTKKHQMNNTGWQRFQQAVKRGKVTHAHMFVALSGAVRDQARVLDELAEVLGAKSLEELAAISTHVANILEMHSVIHIGEKFMELDDETKATIQEVAV